MVDDKARRTMRAKRIACWCFRAEARWVITRQAFSKRWTRLAFARIGLWAYRSARSNTSATLRLNQARMAFHALVAKLPPELRDDG